MHPAPSTGIASIDALLTQIIPGDNIVWQVDNLDDYRLLADAFARRAVADGHPLVYVRFASHPPVVQQGAGVSVASVDPSAGFDAFAREVDLLISGRGRDVFYVFDNLSALVEQWNTDDSLANFFRLTCPHLFELDTVTYFAISRGMHKDSTIARIRDTTQVLVDVLHHEGQTILHPLKAQDRYSPTMFLPHILRQGECQAIFESGRAAEVLSALRTSPLRAGGPASVAPWDLMFERVSEICQDPSAAAPERDALRDDLLRMVMGDRPEFLQLASRYISLEDLLSVRERLIGSGRIGGKAAGMILARKILGRAEPGEQVDFGETLEPHDSFYIGSDVFFSYLVDNRLFRVRLQQGKDLDAITSEFPAIREQFLQGRFSPSVLEQFSRMLDYFGQAPIIVRSSSLLEDDFGNAFAGKYESIFCPNQGHLPDRLEAFTSAVKQVYASALSPDALAYRRKHNLADSDEQMAILVQRVAGFSHGRLFLPLVAGVGFSRSPWVWSERLDPACGLLRLVVGLGTRAVDRVGPDYPRTVFLSHPGLRPEIEASQIQKYSQHFADALDTEANAFVSIPAEDLAASPAVPGAELVFSSLADGSVRDPISRVVCPEGGRPVVTLNNLIRQTDLAAVMRAMLGKLERAYGRAVDTEFTVSVRPDRSVRVNLLQCRPLCLPGVVGEFELPRDIPEGDVLFAPSNCGGAGMKRGIGFIVFIDPDWYDTLAISEKRQLGRVVGLLGNHSELSGEGLLLMGPGRWGSSNIDLGVNVSYADISNASALVEVARSRGGHTPEVSYGTHFFQDLVEDGILYVPVYPDSEESRFNERFFAGAPNSLERFLPHQVGLAHTLKLIDVRAAAYGATVTLMIHPRDRQALCYLER